MARSKKGKFRPDGIWGKVKFDLLPPQGDAEVTIEGYAAFAFAVLAALSLPTGGGAVAFAVPAAVLFLIGTIRS